MDYNEMQITKENIIEKKTNRTLVLISVILAMFMAAIEATIVATAIPSIVGDLGGFSLFSWVFSIFLLMQAITIPIYGKLADLYGRKPIFVIGVVIFLIGSTLSGFAQSMTMLIVYRLVQGIGAGAVQPMATTIVGDIYTMEERAKIQGYLSSVWGISSIVGPAVGGIFVTYFHWSLVFWINIPIGILAILGIVLYLHEDVEKKEHSIDYIGSGLLLVSISSLMVIFIQGGTAWSWTSTPMILLLGLFIIGIGLFLWQERRTKEPIMPLNIWNNRIIVVANLASLTTGAVMIGVSSYLPSFVQGVMERSPMVAGFTLAMMSIGWPLASTFAGKLMIRIGFWATSVIGGTVLIVGAIFFVTLRPEYGPIWAGIGSFFIGVGMGFATTTFIVSIQSSVDWKTRGVATASNMFMRILGNTVGVSLMGGILNIRMSNFLKAQTEKLHLSPNLDVTNTLLDPDKRSLIPHEILKVLQEGLTSSLHSVYWVVFTLSILSLAIILFTPKAKNEYE